MHKHTHNSTNDCFREPGEVGGGAKEVGGGAKEAGGGDKEEQKGWKRDEGGVARWCNVTRYLKSR